MCVSANQRADESTAAPDSQVWLSDHRVVLPTGVPRKSVIIRFSAIAITIVAARFASILIAPRPANLILTASRSGIGPAATLIAVAKTIQKPPPKHPARFVEPMQCLAVAKLPGGPDWEYELKFDGYRAFGIKGGGRARLMSRNGNDFSARFPSLARALSKLPDDTIIDGEIVALDETGRPSFNVLQNHNHSATPLEFYVFDILHLAGENLRDRPLDERRELLRTKLMPRMQDEVRFSETLKASAAEVVAAVKKQGLEGVIAKRRDSLYQPGRRSGAWVKMRINKGQELVIGGYIPAGKNFDSLIVGYYEKGELLYTARVRNGFVPALRVKIFEHFQNLEITTCPFSNLPQSDKGRWGRGLTAEKMAECRWLKPQLVAQIEYADWTDVNHLRHSKFITLRDDKPAKDVLREQPVS
jgi:DNA ligase D-like protein (predicted ligase)